MKLLVFSDVHRQKDKLTSILKKHQEIDMKISLGDSELRSSYLKRHKIKAVKGNYPFDAGIDYELIFPVAGTIFYFTHGHKLYVREGVQNLYRRMIELEAEVAFYGHTHIAACESINGRHMINPGAINRSRSNEKESYVIFEIKEHHYSITWYDAENHTQINAIKLERFSRKQRGK